MEKGGAGALREWRHALLSRRAFLLASAGGLTALFAPSGALAATANPWPVLAAVQNHLFPSELGSPGAREIKALSYLQGVLGDPRGDRDEQRFILKGVDWLEDLGRQRHKASFVDLDPIRREQVLREVANSRPGENWLSTLLLYICEALLTDPVYGGNPEGIGWAWLGHQPGFPRPPSTSGGGAGGEGARLALGSRSNQGSQTPAQTERQRHSSVAPSPPAPLMKPLTTRLGGQKTATKSLVIPRGEGRKA